MKTHYSIAYLLFLSVGFLAHHALAAVPPESKRVAEVNEAISFKDSHVWKEFEARVKALGDKATEKEKNKIYNELLKKYGLTELMEKEALKKLYESTGYFVGMMPCTVRKQDGGELKLFYLVDFGKDKDTCLFKMGQISNHLSSSGMQCAVDEKLGCFDELVYKATISRQKVGKAMERDYVSYLDQDGRFRSLNIDTEPYSPKECKLFEELLGKTFTKPKCVHRDKG